MSESFLCPEGSTFYWRRILLFIQRVETSDRSRLLLIPLKCQTAESAHVPEIRRSDVEAHLSWVTFHPLNFSLLTVNSTHIFVPPHTSTSHTDSTCSSCCSVQTFNSPVLWRAQQQNHFTPVWERYPRLKRKTRLWEIQVFPLNPTVQQTVNTPAGIRWQTDTDNNQFCLLSPALTFL